MIFFPVFRCLVGVALISLPPTQAWASVLPITVSVRAVGAPGIPIMAQLSATAGLPSGEHGSKPRAVQSVPVPGSVTFQLEADVDWELAAASPGFWGAPKVVRPPVTAPVELVLYPSGWLAGRVETVEAALAPAQVSIRLKPGVTPEGVPVAGEPEAVIRCQVTKMEYRCQAPAGLFDLRAGSPGFIPKYLWSVRIPPGQTAKLPVTVLRKGSSISGWVVYGVPVAQRTACQVDVTAAAGGPPQSPQDEARRRELAQRVAVNERGFFQTGAVQPGRYLVTAHAPGLVAADGAQVDVSEGLEAQITNPISLAAPVELTVVVDPPYSISGEHWSLSLAREEHQGRDLTRVGEMLIDNAGQAKFGGLAPGTYQLTVGDHRQQRWLDETLAVEPGMATQFVRVPVVQVEGRLYLGKTPAEGAIWFRGERDARRVVCFAKEEGRFRCALPGPGLWTVDVQIKGDRARQEVDPVEVAAPPPGAVAELDVVVPDRPLTGRVEDTHGAAVAGARVHFVHVDDMGESNAVANGNGEFEIRSVPLGAATIQAMDARGLSETRQLTIEDGKAPEKVILTIKPRAAIEGHVVSQVGPIAGALVEAMPDITPGGTAMLVPRTTDVDGSFRIEALTQSAGASLLVVPPGFGVRLFRVVLDQAAGTSIEVAVDQLMGAITLSLEPAAAQTGALSLWLVHDGGAVPLSMLASAGLVKTTSSERGSYATIVGLAGGDYAVCAKYPLLGSRGTPTAGSSSSGTCASGYLAPGGSLELKLGRP